MRVWRIAIKLVAITPVKNEERFIGLTGRVILRWCDAWVVLLHDCSDGSREVVEEISQENPGRVTTLIEHGPTWNEMEHRQRLLEAARREGATHIALVDADEVISYEDREAVRQHLEASQPGSFVRVPLKNICDSLETYRNEDSVWGRSVTEIGFADHPSLLWMHRNGYQHHHRKPFNSVEGYHLNMPVVMHLQMLDREFLVAKHAWYKMTERLRYPDRETTYIDQIYSMAPNRDGIELAPVPLGWLQPWLEHYSWWKHLPRLQPWHQAECRRLWQQYGAERFQGLDLFGVV